MEQSKSTHPLSMQQYLLYRLRFAMDASLCEAFGRFGGALAQLTNISIILQLYISENPDTAILHDGELQNRLSKYARERTPSIDYYLLLSTVQVDLLRIVIRRITQSASHNRQRPPVAGVKGERGSNGEKGQNAKGKG